MKYDFFVIGGPISQLQLCGDVLNLLAPYQERGSLASGLAGAASGQHGTAANAVLVASYEGEEVDRFACYIGDHLVEGVFSRVMLENGDQVKAVVEKQKDRPGVLYAHAVLRPRDGLLAMPYNTGRGTWAELRKNFRWGAWLALGSVLVMSIFNLLEGWNWAFFLFLVAGTLPLMVVMALWAWLAESEGDISTAIFKALEFPKPESLNLMPSAICPNEGYLHEYAIFRYRRVVKAKDDRHGSPEPEPLKPYAEALAERQGLLNR